MKKENVLISLQSLSLAATLVLAYHDEWLALGMLLTGIFYGSFYTLLKNC